MKTSDFDYELPQELIAQTPRRAARSAAACSSTIAHTGAVEHKIFRDVIDYLNPGDVLVINQTRVIPARLLRREGRHRRRNRVSAPHAV